MGDSSSECVPPYFGQPPAMMPVSRAQRVPTCLHHSVPFKSFAAPDQFLALIKELKVVNDCTPAAPKLYTKSVNTASMHGQLRHIQQTHRHSYQNRYNDHA